MVITMNDSNIKSVKDVERILEKARGLDFKRNNQQECYGWTEKILRRFKYLKLSKNEKGVIKRYIEKNVKYSPLSRPVF